MTQRRSKRQSLPVIPPFGALPGFNVQAVMREVAAHYGVDWHALRKDGRSSELIALARHALFWKLATQHKLSPNKIAGLIGKVSGRQVRDGVELHQKRIEQFRTAHQIKIREQG